MATRLLPVNNSAPPMTTRTSPRLNAAPPISLVIPNPAVEPVTTTAKNSAPRLMNAPARTASTSMVTASFRALVTPRLRTRSAICCGE